MHAMTDTSFSKKMTFSATKLLSREKLQTLLELQIIHNADNMQAPSCMTAMKSQDTL
jgi:hypothetical protein